VSVIRDVLLVAAGGAVGSVLRFGVSTWLPTTGLPWATLAVNIVGSFALGALVLPSGADHSVRLLVGVGLLGGLTTMSAFSVETIDLLRSGHPGLAVGNLLANAAGGPLAALAGWKALA
jgi:fluoride exporter